MNKHDKLISNLGSGLQAISPPPNINRLATTWFLLSAICVVAITQLAGPIRPGAFSQLAMEPRFLLETILGLVAILWISLLAFRSAVPAALSGRFATAGSVLMALWLAQYVVGFVSPALEPSELGKRPYCYLETMAYALPLILAGLILARRFYPLKPARTAISMGLAAGMMPALYMQIACMYEPMHILSYHILPGMLMVAVSAVITLRWKLRRSSSER
jgi:hypothetical protein